MRASMLMTVLSAMAVIIVFANVDLKSDVSEPPGIKAEREVCEAFPWDPRFLPVSQNVVRVHQPPIKLHEDVQVPRADVPSGRGMPFYGEARDTADTIRTYFLQTEYAPVADYIVALSIQETGWWRSKFHLERQNYFSTKMKPDGVYCKTAERNCLTSHADIFESCTYVLNGVFRKHHYAKDPEGFLNDLVKKGYARDATHADDTRDIAKRVTATFRKRP